MLNEARKEGKNMLFEGAQGTGLDIDFGTYPLCHQFSNATAGGACTGTRRRADLYRPRRRNCQSLHNARWRRAIPDANGQRRIEESSAAVRSGTSSERRLVVSGLCGWFDAPADAVTRHVRQRLGISLIITKFDVFDQVQGSEAVRRIHRR